MNKKEKLQQLQTLESLLEKGDLIINDLECKKIKEEEFSDYFDQFCSFFKSIDLDEGDDIKVRNILMDKIIENAKKLKVFYYEKWHNTDVIKSICFTFNSFIKERIRDIYLELAEHDMNSILHRKISLNSKRLALINYKKNIKNINHKILPYSIIIEEKRPIVSLDRECDEKISSYHIV